MKIGNQAFCLFLYLTDLHFQGELQHVDDASLQKIKFRPIITREIGGASLSYVVYACSLIHIILVSQYLPVQTHHNGKKIGRKLHSIVLLT